MARHVALEALACLHDVLAVVNFDEISSEVLQIGCYKMDGCSKE
jgi:hypothetical protein